MRKMILMLVVSTLFFAAVAAKESGPAAVAVSRGKLDIKPFATELMSRGLDVKDALLAKAGTCGNAVREKT